jgi:hypothetical protein
VRNDNKTLKIFALFLCMTGAGCVTWRYVHPLDANRHYEPDGPFSYAPPAGWQIRDHERSPFKALSGTVGGTVPVLVVFTKSNYPGMLKPFTAGLYREILREDEEAGILTPRYFKMPHRDRAVKFAAREKVGRRDCRRTYYVFQKDSRRLHIVAACTTPAAAGGAADAALDELMRSFRFEREKKWWQP